MVAQNETIIARSIGGSALDCPSDRKNVPISFHEWCGSRCVFFFSLPADCTPVCTTEMGRTAQRAGDFAARNVKPLGLSTDTADEHRKWIEDVNDTQHTDCNSPSSPMPICRLRGYMT